MASSVFDCSLCGGIEIEDLDLASPECITCDEIDCRSCLTDEGVCVPCG